MSDTTNLVLIIFLIFFVSVALLLFFNITYRYIGRLSRIDLIVILVVMIAFGLFALNLLVFSRGYGDTRNAQRSQDVMTIADSVSAYIQDARTRIQDLGTVPLCPATKKIGNAPGNINLGKLLAETLPVVPQDPSGGNTLDSGYAICITETSRIEIIAPLAENNKLIVTKK